MWISPAYAQATSFLGDPNSPLGILLPMGLIFVVFYFFMIRPQQQKQKQAKAMLDALRRGDRVVTGGGIIGIVAKVGSNDEIFVDIAEGTRVRVLRSTIATVLAKTEPVAAKEDAPPPDEADSADKPAGDKDKRKGARGTAAGK